MPSTSTDRIDGLTTSVAVKAPCKAVSTTALTLSGEQTVNGVACVAGDRVLYALAGGSVDNGIWVVAEGQWSRAKDFDGARDVVKGTLVLVAPGTDDSQIYVVTTDGVIQPGTTTITIEEFSGDSATLIADLANQVSASKGAGLVGYDASLAYAAGTVGAWLNNEVSVFRFIPTAQHAAILAGTSTYDASGDIADAITYALTRTPCRLVFPTGKYKCDAVLGAYTGSDIIIDFNGSTLDFSAIATSSTDSLLWFQGSYGTGVALSSQAASGQKTVACVSTGFAVGDLVRVYSEDIFDTGRTDTRIGELNFIETVPDGTSVTCTMELQGAYSTADTAKIEKLTPVRNVIIKNGRLIGPSGNDELRGLRLRVAVNCHIENISSFDIDYLHMQLTDCIACSVRGCYFEESNNAATAYGISFADASCDCIAYGNFFVNVRHALSTNNNVTTSYGVADRIRFEMNDVRDSAKATGGTGGDAIDTHAGCRSVDIINNTVHSSSNIGINCEARTARIIGNRVKHTASVGIYHHPYADQVGHCLIANNTVELVGDGSGTDPGIFVFAGGSAAQSRVTIVGNHVESATSEAMRVYGQVASTLRYVTIVGNTCRTSTGTAGLQMGYAQNVTISGNNFMGASDYGIYLTDVSYVAIGVNNVGIGGTATNGYVCRIDGTSTRNIISGLIGEDSGTYTNSYGVFLADTVTNTGVYGCTFGNADTAVTLGAGTGNAQANNT